MITAAAALLVVDPPPDAAAQTALPDLKIAATTPSVAEGKTLTFTITASDPTLDRDLTVNVQVTEDTSQGQTYLNASERGSKRAVIYAGSETGTFTVKTVDDNNDEPNGAVTVTLRPGTGYTVGATDAATGTVTDKDGTHVTLSIGKSIIPENGGKTDITYRLRGPLKAGQTIAFKTGTRRNSDGRQGVDWTLQKKPGADNTGVTLSTSGTVNGVTATAQNPIVTMTGAGVREAKLELTAVDDSNTSNRQIAWFVGSNGGISNIFVQTLGEAQGSFRVSGRNHIYLIDDDNPPAPVIGFSKNAFSGPENGGLVQPVVNFSRVATPEFELPLTFTAGTATEGADYHEPGPQIVDLASSSSAGVSFDIHLIDDKHKEGDETLTVAIDMDALPDLNGDSEGNGWVAGTHTTATITINDNDRDVHASISALDNIATEGSSSDKARFRVNLDSVRGAAGPLTDGDSARINFAFTGGARGKDFDVKLLTNHPTVSYEGTSEGTSVKFNPNAVTPAQDTPLFADFELIAREDNDTVDDVVKVKLTVVVAGSGSPTGTSSGEAVITLRDNDQEATGLRLRGGLDGPIADDNGVFTIGEGSSSTFFFGLTEAPTDEVTATASISSGGHTASITSGASHMLPMQSGYCRAPCPWRVDFIYNYNTQSATLHGAQIVIEATEDIATVPTDDVTLRIALRSHDKNYDGAVYEYPIRVIDNEQPITVGLVSTSAVNLPESQNGRIKLAVRASRPVYTELTPKLTWPDPSDTGHFTPEQDIDIAVEPIPVGGTMGYIYLDAKDDNIAEVQATATATLSLEETDAGVTVNENRNTFLLRHGDDDNLNIRLIKRYASDNTVSHALYFTRPVDYAIEVFLKGKDSNDDRTLGIPSTVSQANPNLTKPHEYTIHGGVDQYSAIVVRTLGENYTFFDRQAIVVSDGIQLVDHDDDIPVIGPPLRPQSSEASPQGEVRDALTTGSGGGDSLDDRVSAVSVSDVSPDGFTLGWSAANGVDSYEVRYWQDENAVTGVPVAGTTYTVTGLDAETEYSAQIMAVVNGNVATNKSSSVIAVTTAAAATPAPAAQACNLPSDAISVAEVTGWRDALDTTKAAAGIKRWDRVLAALGVETGETPMTVTQARAVSNWLKNTRWDRTARTLSALDQCDDPPPATPAATPPTPEISIASDGDVTEGSAASFTISASPAPAADLTVSVNVSQSGDYGATIGAQTVTIPTSGTYTLTVATSDDSVDEADGSVTATVNTGTGYTVSSSASAATAAVSDNDDPPSVCKLPADAITVAEVTGWRDALDTTKAAAGIKRWNRVLAALGEDTGLTPMSADLAQTVSNWLKNTRWDRTARTLDAVEQCDN
ncbi:fibronectin type III domain-containing protein [Candidatus Poriferisodalis sp.]|uniref:fibronectin type III domain-containing protein n=1 Tax=Candidatus Poriferisodalis sp. TaxID=3101277 RepID=UPI003B51C6AB